MPAEPYLLAVIAHGTPVFEIGYKLECPLCEAGSEHLLQENLCIECDGLGHWWITNSGWRARPYWFHELESLGTFASVLANAPDDHPDLFQSYIDRTPKLPINTERLQALGLLKAKPPIVRRTLR